MHQLNPRGSRISTGKFEYLRAPARAIIPGGPTDFLNGKSAIRNMFTRVYHLFSYEIPHLLFCNSMCIYIYIHRYRYLHIYIYVCIYIYMNQESETFTQKDSKYKMLGLHLKECQEPRTTLAVEMPYQQLGRPHFWVRQPFARAAPSTGWLSGSQVGLFCNCWSQTEGVLIQRIHVNIT